MLLQIALGSGLLIVSILIGALSAWAMEFAFARLHHWLMREPHWPKLMVVITGVSFWVLGIITVGVWIWALAFFGMGLFATFEAAMYFSLATFTTLGYGDMLLSAEWRIFGAIAAVNGLLCFGLLIALLVEALRHVRLGQVEVRRKRG